MNITSNEANSLPTTPTVVVSDSSSEKGNIERFLANANRYSFFEALRDLELAHPHLPRIGQASSPAQEPFRVHQPANLTFAPSAIDDARGANDGNIEIDQRFFGLLGPGGPLPIHITEIIRNRSRHANDHALQAFLDIFHHRMATLFYRAWSSARPAIQRDRPREDRFFRYLGAMIGTGLNHGLDRDAWADESKVFFASHLASQRGSAEGLAAILRSLIDSPVAIHPFALRWLKLSNWDRSQIGGGREGRPGRSGNNSLGVSTILGSKVPDRQSSFEIEIGPTGYKTFESLLPGSPKRKTLRAILLNHSGVGLDARVRLVLRKEEVPRSQLGRFGQLGRNVWVQSRPADRDRNDYCFEATGIDNKHGNDVAAASDIALASDIAAGHNASRSQEGNRK